jgi:uncharacterized protein (TIGR02266 family)
MSTPPLPTDRRADVRRAVNREFASVEEFVSEYVVNISRSGIFIRSDDPLPVGTKVALKFTVILDELETIEGVGEVVRVVAPGPGVLAGMGIVFVELSTYSRALVERILVRR